jgi:hypothetical protein
MDKTLTIKVVSGTIAADVVKTERPKINNR